ncbi:MAG: hypothetical protein HC831_27940, partial [Chloroflexia bacterium]|nr:hypothetical protein [Chloroflexia bacterium]
LSGSDKFSTKYTKAEFNAFTKHMMESIKGIEGDQEVIKRIFLGIYANPLINQYNLEKIPTEQEV